METHNSPNAEVEDWLATLGVERLCQWDVLVFVYRHQASLVSAEDIARLLGYPTSEVVDALDHLESLQFVERSRAERGVRLYQFTAPADPRRGDAFGQLRALADHRAGRLLLTKKLRRGISTSQSNDDFRGRCEEGRVTWLKAI